MAAVDGVARWKDMNISSLTRIVLLSHQQQHVNMFVSANKCLLLTRVDFGHVIGVFQRNKRQNVHMLPLMA